MLYSINLAGNKISKIEGLDNMEGVLEGLDLSDNHISKIEGLEKVEDQLHWLNLQGNRIPKIECDAFQARMKHSHLEDFEC